MSLRVLRLNRNCIGDAGAVALSYLISHGGGDNNGRGDNNDEGGSNGMPSSLLCFSLEELSLADNHIGALGIAALLQASSPSAINHNHNHHPHHSNGHYHVSQGRPSSSSSKLSYTGASALRRLSLAHTNLSLVSLHDIGTTTTYPLPSHMPYLYSTNPPTPSLNYFLPSLIHVLPLILYLIISHVFTLIPPPFFIPPPLFPFPFCTRHFLPFPQRTTSRL